MRQGIAEEIQMKYRQFLGAIERNFPGAPVEFPSCTVCMELDPEFDKEYRMLSKGTLYTGFFDKLQYSAFNKLVPYGLDWLRQVDVFHSVMYTETYVDMHTVYLKYEGWGGGKWQVLARMDRSGRHLCMEDTMRTLTNPYELLSEGEKPRDFSNLVRYLRDTRILKPVPHCF